MTNHNTPITDLKNLGPASAEWLEAVGICTEADLMRVGPVVAFRMVEQAGLKPTIAVTIDGGSRLETKVLFRCDRGSPKWEVQVRSLSWGQSWLSPW